MAESTEKIEEQSPNKTKKILLIVVPVVALLFVIAVVLALVLSSSLTKTAKKLEKDTRAAVSEISSDTVAQPSLSEEIADDATETPLNADYEVYETRDPFRPSNSTSTPAPSTTKIVPLSSGDSSTSPTAEASEEQVLSLSGINNENGTLFASVEYDSSPYTVRSGERVGESSFQVTAISGDSASFLYGDDTVTLQVGEDITK